MSKEDFIAVFETTLLCANLEVTGLSLVLRMKLLIEVEPNMALFFYPKSERKC